MNTRLDPPPVPPLPPAERDRIRRRVMTKSRPTTGTPIRRWVPAVAVGAVAAVAVGGVVIGRLNTASPPPVGGRTPTPSLSLSAPATKPAEAPADVDLGPLAGAAEIASRSCKIQPGPIQVLWARQVQGAAAGSKEAVLLVKGSAQPGGTYDHGIAVCQAGAMITPVRDTEWDEPTGARDLTPLGSGGISTPPSAYVWTLYRARPNIARIETRYVWQGGSSPWRKGVVTGGFAFADFRVSFTKKAPPGLEPELRAYDAAGRPVPVKPW
ncbi:hypothetical protein HPO96_10175 [Kribbella sandramycini]|uniref:Uncharacterized protein n=1 Tax=Kribbella sandramycini TaxID=60450 RepID=A0A7Y4NYJ9_9ACTN|nr:hypothetical protein [Kribbella sandramycini]MBB6569555.1 hypothetical protein [Kribbella sandramycini]NOL40611.1 hypothetical protein [Kribbella sandramycini]